MRNSIRFAVLSGLALSAASISQGALIGHWTFDEASSGTGTTAQDATANNRDGTINGGVTYVAGQVGAGALSFDGSTGYVQVEGANGTPLDLNGSQYTVAWWSKTTSVHSGLNVMIGNDDGQNYADGVLISYVSFDGFLRAAQIRAGGTGGADMQVWDPGFDVSLGEWVHLAVTYNDATNTRTLYVNGAYFAATPGTIYNAGSNGTTDLYFGRYTINDSGYYAGALDDIRIYDEALTEAQISAIMVPEPSMIGLVGLGLLGMVRRRRS